VPWYYLVYWVGISAELLILVGKTVETAEKAGAGIEIAKNDIGCNYAATAI